MAELWPQLGLRCAGLHLRRKRRVEEREDGLKQKEGSEEGDEAPLRNINREEMKQHPHFLFFAYSLRLPPGIDDIKPDMLVTPF